MNPLVLAIDTTREYGSLALARGGETLEELLVHAPAGFAQVLYRELSALLERNRVKLQDVDCFAAASGPGSFTGVRVGLACVKGLAEACRKPAAGISNLRALARFGSAPLRAPIIDARRNEIYGAVYDAKGDLVAPEVVAPFADWFRTLPEGPIDTIAQDRIHHATVPAPQALAGAIAQIAVEKLCRGERPDPAALDANYVRRSDAELFWKD